MALVFGTAIDKWMADGIKGVVPEKTIKVSLCSPTILFIFKEIAAFYE